MKTYQTHIYYRNEDGDFEFIETVAPGKTVAERVKYHKDKMAKFNEVEALAAEKDKNYEPNYLKEFKIDAVTTVSSADAFFNKKFVMPKH